MSRILKIIAAVLAVFIFSSSGEIASYEPLDRDNLKLNFTVISDGHIEGNNSQRHKNYGEAFCDMAAAEEISKALVMVGDNTMNGQGIEETMLYGLMNKYNKIENVLMAVGNHEVCRDDTDFEKLEKRFIKYNNAFLEHKIDKLYHSQVIDGYYFIILATDRNSGVEQYISDEQFEWLDNELKTAAESGNPVFVFNHWPMNDTFSEVWPEGHVGEQSERLYQFLTKYDNRVFLFTGHLHMGIFENDYGIKEDGKITYINVPSFGSENYDGDADVQDTGMGLQVEVYDTQLIVRIRNFVTHQWTDYEYHFDI